MKEFKLDFKNYKFVDAIIEAMKETHINKFTFKLNFGGGYSLKLIKNNKYVYDSINIFKVETCKELLNKLGINKEFEICKVYKTNKIKCLEVSEIKKKIDNKKYMEFMKIYFDSHFTYLFKIVNDKEILNQYNYLLYCLSLEYDSIILLENKLYKIVNNSFEDLTNKKYYNLYKWSVSNGK